MTFNVKSSGTFGARLQERIAAWQGRKIAAKLQVPPELSWWYWQEYGTATRGERPQASGHTYRIEPVNAKALSWPGPGGERIVRMVVEAHPGIPPRHSVLKAMDDIREATQEHIQTALREGAADNPETMRGAVVSSVATAKQHIVTSIAANIPGTREDGKLQGQTAASVFESGAEVIDLST